MRCLISGGAGYIGSILVPRLLEDGHQVTVLDNFLHGQASLNHLCSNPGFDVVRGDCRDRRVLGPLMKDADVIVPLAALVGAPMCDADNCAAVQTNQNAVASIVALASSEQRILIPITNSGYGIGEVGKECTEDSPLRPISLYGRTKVNAEQIALNHGNTISFRLATVFGASPRMRTDLLVNSFVYKAMRDRAIVIFEGHFKRNFIAIHDVARVFLHGIDNFETMKGRPYNVGLSDANLSKIELCQRIQAHLPDFVFMEAQIGSDPDKRDYVVNNSRIEGTGFCPIHSLDDGIQELIKLYSMLRNERYGNV